MINLNNLTDKKTGWLLGIAFIVYCLAAIFTRAVTSVYVWNTFMPHLGLPLINIPLAMGLGIVFTLIFDSDPFVKKSENDNSELAVLLMRPFIFYGLCALFTYVLNFYL